MSEILHEIASLADGAVFSSKKDHFVPIGGFLALGRRARRAARASSWSSTRASRTTAAWPGTTWRRWPQGIREAADERIVAAIGSPLPRRAPAGKRGPDRRAGRGPRGLPRREAVPAAHPAGAVPRAGARRRGLRRGRRALDGARHRLGPARQTTLRRPRARTADVAEARLQREHLDYVAETVARVLPARDEIAACG